MNKIGPPADWEDTTAPSLNDLPNGAILELINDLIVQKDVNNSHLTNYFVEMQTNVISVADYLNLYLYKRFALATFFNENNIVTPVSYKKGTILVIENIKKDSHINTMGFETTQYILNFKPSAVPNSISWMKVIGRRGGTSDIKIPQFKKLLSKYFKVTEPKN